MRRSSSVFGTAVAVHQEWIGRWVPGDIVFFLGAVVLVIFVARLETGRLLYLNANEPHSVRAVEGSPLLLTILPRK